jgi:hypothetical protein
MKDLNTAIDALSGNVKALVLRAIDSIDKQRIGAPIRLTGAYSSDNPLVTTLLSTVITVTKRDNVNSSTRIPLLSLANGNATDNWVELSFNPWVLEALRPQIERRLDDPNLKAEL